MSYILDALKRADQERQVGQVPNVVASAQPRVGHSNAFRRWLPAILISSVALLAAVMAYWLASAPDAQPIEPTKKAVSLDESVQPADAQAPIPEVTSLDATGPTRVTPLAVAPTIVVERKTEPALAESEPDVDKTVVVNPVVAVQVSESEPQESVAITGNAIQDATAPPEVSDSAPQSAPEYEAEPLSELPWLSALSVEFRRNVPELAVQFHRYSDNADKRFVMIDGVRYQEGQVLKSGPELEQIIDSGVVLRWRGERFRYPLN